MKMTKKILIIGSGPSALSACIRLLREENIQIYLLDGKDLLNIENSGYRLITNAGEDGGQEVPHFHIHILAGEKIGRLR